MPAIRHLSALWSAVSSALRVPANAVFGVLAVALVALVVSPRPAAAHPHVFVEAREEMVFDSHGNITAIRHVWRFDDSFSAFATQGLDKNGDGILSTEELAPLAKVNVDSLGEYRYFTFLSIGNGKPVKFAAPTEYWLDGTNGILTLFYTLPLREPIDPAGKTIRLDVYDPEYFVDFTLTDKDPFALVPARAGAGTPAGVVPKGCTTSVKRPDQLDPMTATTLSLIPADQRELPPNLRAVTEQLANIMTVKCPEKPAVVAPVAAASDPAPRSVGASPFGVGLMESGGPPIGFLAVIAAWQQSFYHQLTAAVRAMKTDGTAIWVLMAVSVAYGIFHAAGPGHGKAVISAYLVSNRGTARKAIVLSFLSALVQSTVAILIVTIGAVILRVTSFGMTAAAEWVEIASYAAVTLLGVTLVWRKIVRPLAASSIGRLRRPRPATLGFGAARFAPLAAAGPTGGLKFQSAAPAPRAAGSALSGPSGSMKLRLHGDALPEDHVHGADCGCGGVVNPADLAPGWRSAAGAVLSAGLRPCTGALIVLVFTLAQGVYSAGVAATYAMGVGTGATVSALALLAVGARGLAMRIAAFDSRAGLVLNRAVEAGGALVVLAFGAILLSASLLPHLA
ncbi:HoxN/HupN/NixA family nickel/cobalt transporter [Segnochrobactrum spirostomi]|uniref:DUF1007 family protein n=1 Tax=Segnochrobactrum spirostomi TaxID=2608987 RepID=A0A6A7Y1T7_9HYPH|nr:DUF1007 family protein [Segnochrobactrum spirostomi]MQT12984.1 DUF1007 family protein [Segnochrobactrum spirostomi]